MPHQGLQLCQSLLPHLPTSNMASLTQLPVSVSCPKCGVSYSFIPSEAPFLPKTTGYDWQGDNYRLGTWPTYSSLNAVTSVLSQL